MYQPYLDIREKLGRPLWFDEEGVPRYAHFAPRLCANIYADFAALLEIRCQSCGQLFQVAASWCAMDENAVWDEHGNNPRPAEGLPTAESSGYFRYGDAPWHGPNDGQCSGTTMTTDVSEVMQFWRRDDSKWRRDCAHEFCYKLERPR